MKVLILATTTNIQSGWGRLTHSILDEYQKKSIDFTVLTEDSSISFKQGQFKLFPAKNILTFIKNIFTVRKIAREYDVIHAFDGWPYAVYGYFAVLGTQKKLISIGVGTYSVAPLHSKIKGFFLRRAYKRCNHILCISNYTRDQILKFVPEANTTVVLQGISFIQVLSSQQKSEFEKKFQLSKAYPVILSIGAIKHRKGQLDTTHAIAVLKKDFPHIQYLIVGNADDRKYINAITNFAEKEGIKDSIKIIPNADGDDALSFFYDRCNIFALNSNNDGSHFEGFGLVFLEAYQFGKPGIGSSSCGIEDAILDGQTGYLTEQGNSQDIAEKIKLILDSDKEFWEKNTHVFAKKFSWEKTAEAYLESYKN